MSDAICRGVKDTSTGKARVTVPLGRNLLGEVVLTRDGYLRLQHTPPKAASILDLSLLTATRTHKLPDSDGTLALSSSVVTDHGALTGLADDDHSQYPLSVGRATGQKIVGGTAASENLAFESTSHATKGEVQSSDLFRALAGMAIDTGFSLDIGGDTYAEGSISPKSGRDFSILGAQDTVVTNPGKSVTVRGGPGGATSGLGGHAYVLGGAGSGGSANGNIYWGDPSTLDYFGFHDAANDKTRFHRDVFLYGGAIGNRVVSIQPNAGDASIAFGTLAGVSWSLGNDYTDGKLKIQPNSAVGTSTQMTFDSTAGISTQVKLDTSASDLVIDNAAADPGTPAVGQVWINTTTKELRFEA